MINLNIGQRLGHFAEEIFFKTLRSQHNEDKLTTNLQIIQNKTTLGELDAVLSNTSLVNHIEFCYKVYLFDPSLSSDEFKCWIGPNRRDSLQEKVAKLKSKQLPLFYHPTTKEMLADKISDFPKLVKKQSVCFLGQLFVPLSMFESNTQYQYGTPDGFYIHYEELDKFENYKWFIPGSKTDWPLSPSENVEWYSIDDFKEQLTKHYHRNSNPMCWSKAENGRLTKCFVVNWKSH